MWGAAFLGGLGAGRRRTNWIGLPLARMRSSTSISGKEARNLFRLLEPKLRTSKSENCLLSKFPRVPEKIQPLSSEFSSVSLMRACLMELKGH